MSVIAVTRRALVVEADSALRKEISDALHDVDVSSVEFAMDAADALRRVRESSPDIVLLDVRMPGVSGIEVIAQLKNASPGTAVVALTGSAATKAPHLSYADAVSVNPFDVRRLKRAIEESLKRRQPRASEPEPWGRSSAAAHVVRDLHDAETGRLDARRIADYLVVPLAVLATALDVKVATLHKTPASTSLQPKLAPIAWIIGVLLLVFRSREDALAWLNSPHPDLGKRQPMSFILEGKATSIAEMLEATLAGQPS